MKKILKSKALRYVLTVLWCVVIFLFSANDADTSSEQSDVITDICIDTFVPDYDSLSGAEQEDIFDTVSFMVRKTAHFTEYLILGALIFWCLHRAGDKRVRTACSAVGASLYSVTDELHQLFSDGRSCELRDVLIDSGGGLLGAFLGLLILVIYEKKKVK